MSQRIDFTGRLDGRTPLGDGSVRYTARLTRTGVFDYGDHRELRLADDVFAPEALASFKGLTVTDGHKAMVTPDNWKAVSLGHVGDDVRADGDYVVASVILKDASAIARADKGELIEVSMGYTVRLDTVSGKTEEGLEYDAIQRDIRGNHCALGPRKWGRAGENVCLDGSTYYPGMTVARIDAPSTPTAATTDKVSELESSVAAANARADKAAAELVSANARADKAEAERDAAKEQLVQARTDAAANLDAQIEARVSLIDAARPILGKDFVFKGKTSKEIQLATLSKALPNVKLDGKSDDYIAARFDQAVETVNNDQAALAAVNTVISEPKTVEESPYQKALKAREDAIKNYNPSAPPEGAIVRS